MANIEPRILEENPVLSNCTNDTNTENMIIHGDYVLPIKLTNATENCSLFGIRFDWMKGRVISVKRVIRK